MIREAGKKDKDNFGAPLLGYQLATSRCKDSILQNEDVVLQLSAVFKCVIESILHDEENPIDRFFPYTLDNYVNTNFMSIPTAKKLLRLLKIIGWDQSPEFNATNIKLIVAQKNYQDGRVEISGEYVLRLMQTIFAGGKFPQSGKDLLDKLNQKKEAEIKAKAEQEEMEAKKLKRAPDSAQKRSLYELNPRASHIFYYVERSAKKRKITETEEDTWAEFSNPAGGEETRKVLCEIPPPRRSSSNDIDSFSMDSKLAGTGFSKDYNNNNSMITYILDLYGGL